MEDFEKLIKLIIEQEFFTKEEKPIEFDIHEQSPDKNDQLGRGWVVHKIEAKVDGKPAGYIKISYIPHENFKEEYSNIVQFVDKIRGRSFYPGKKYKSLLTKRFRASDDFNELPLKAQVVGLDNMIGEWPYYFDRNNPDDHSEEELLELKNQFIERLWEKFGKAFEEFKDFHVEKPLVDFIRVYPDFQRQRIGIALYEKAARWLAEKGLKLYASGLQSDEAKKAWEWLQKHKGANIGTEKHGDRTRMYLSYL